MNCIILGIFLFFSRAVPPSIHCQYREETRHPPSLRPFDIAHREAYRKGQPVITNLFALRGARSNQECCFFRSTCPLGMSRQARRPPAATVIWISPSAAREQAQRRKRQARVNEASQAKVCPATKGSVAGMNTYSGVSPIGRTGGLGNTVVSYAPWDF